MTAQSPPASGSDTLKRGLLIAATLAGIGVSVIGLWELLKPRQPPQE